MGTLCVAPHFPALRRADVTAKRFVRVQPDAHRRAGALAARWTDSTSVPGASAGASSCPGRDERRWLRRGGGSEATPSGGPSTSEPRAACCRTTAHPFGACPPVKRARLVLGRRCGGEVIQEQGAGRAGAPASGLATPTHSRFPSSDVVRSSDERVVSSRGRVEGYGIARSPNGPEVSCGSRFTHEDPGTRHVVVGSERDPFSSSNTDRGSRAREESAREVP